MYWWQEPFRRLHLLLTIQELDLKGTSPYCWPIFQSLSNIMPCHTYRSESGHPRFSVNRGYQDYHYYPPCLQHLLKMPYSVMSSGKIQSRPYILVLYILLSHLPYWELYLSNDHLDTPAIFTASLVEVVAISTHYLPWSIVLLTLLKDYLY